MINRAFTKGRSTHLAGSYRPIERLTARRFLSRIVALFGSSALIAPLLFSEAAQAQTQAQTQTQTQAQTPADTVVPTVRYARGEDVELSEIITEWRGYYEDVPVYLCVCQDATCDQTKQWPYREYQRFQLGLALGPSNGLVAEASGANCFDIADNSRPDAPRQYSAAQTDRTPSASAIPPTPPTQPSAESGGTVTAPVAPPATVQTPTQATPQQPAPASPVAPTAGGIPTATAVNNGTALRLTWPSGTSNDIAIAGSTWNINVLDALDCETTSRVEQKMLSAQRIVGEVAVDSETGNVAVPVLLESCVDTDQSAVFVLDPSEGGGYSLYRTQLPGDRTFPNEFSSYPFNSITDARYWNGALYIQQGTASGAESVVIFRADRTPAGSYAGCGFVRGGEGVERLCPAQ